MILRSRRVAINGSVQPAAIHLRTRVGFSPASRERLMAQLRPLQVSECPFANLLEARGGRWGEGLTAEKMKECAWVRPELVAEVGFVEWTPEGHLRHARFSGMRDGNGTEDKARPLIE